MPDTGGEKMQKTPVTSGEKTHRVLKCEHVTKQDDRVSQRHEKIVTERIK